MHLYCLLLDELFSRLTTMRTRLGEIAIGIRMWDDARVEYEIKMLQLRKCFELVAVIAAEGHAQIYEQFKRARMEESVLVENLCRKMRAVNPEFFPNPIARSEAGYSIDGQQVWNIQSAFSSALHIDEAEFLAVYREILTSFSHESRTSPSEPSRRDFLRLKMICEKIIRTMMHHQITLGGHHFIAGFGRPPEIAKSSATLFGPSLTDQLRWCSKR